MTGIAAIRTPTIRRDPAREKKAIMANRIAVMATLAIRRVGLSRFKVAILSIYQIIRAQPVKRQPPNGLTQRHRLVSDRATPVMVA